MTLRLETGPPSQTEGRNLWYGHASSGKVVRKFPPSANDAHLGSLVCEYLSNKKVERGSSYNFLAAVDRTLHMSFGTSLLAFRVPEQFVIRPVKHGEFRTFIEGRGWAVVCQTQGVARVELADAISLIPLAVFDNDRSSVNLSGLHFSMESCELLILYHPDADHMDWNCVKNACTGSSWFPWKVGGTSHCSRVPMVSNSFRQAAKLCSIGRAPQDRKSVQVRFSDPGFEVMPWAPGR